MFDFSFFFVLFHFFSFNSTSLFFLQAVPLLSIMIGKKKVSPEIFSISDLN